MQQASQKMAWDTLIFAQATNGQSATHWTKHALRAEKFATAQQTL